MSGNIEKSVLKMLDNEFRKNLLQDADLFTDIIGQDEAKKQLKTALLTERNMILVGPPGIGKTTLAKNVAKLLPDIKVNECIANCLPEKPVCPECVSGKKQKVVVLKGEKRFIRIQGSPDLTSEDLLGDIDPIKAMKYGPLSLEAFTPGKIFRANNGILFFDEVNRCPEKLQNALLQVLEEKKATIGNYEMDFHADFIFIGTMNPYDSSTERLSDVFVDRFDLIYMDYPESLKFETEIVRTKGKKILEFKDSLLDVAVGFVRSLRNSPQLEKLPSVRASIGIYERAQAHALLKKRSNVVFEDIEAVLLSVLAHRIKLKPSIRYVINPADFIKDEFKKFIEGSSTTKNGDYR